MTTFAKFEENNDHEGETWIFWLQIEGNEDELERLGAALAEQQDEDPNWSLDPEIVLVEHDVEVLEAFAGQGYLNLHTKVTGVLRVPDGFVVDKLYKGGVEELFTKVAP